MLHCLFIKKVDSLFSNNMVQKRNRCNYSSSEKYRLLKELLELHYFQHLGFRKLSEKTGVPSTTIQHWITTFEAENPQMAEQMKKQGKEVTPEDYKNLLREIAELKKSLAQEKLRADFYEEMVAFGKEVYGIDLKKAGTK